MLGTRAIQMEGITKCFGSVVANDHISLDLYRGEILSLLGENGSGKTTLMNMLAGIYFPDDGVIHINGAPVVIRSPHDALDLGIGMIHQHFKLVDVLTAAENIILGIPGSMKLDMKTVNRKVAEISEKYGFVLDPKKKIYDMSVSEKQTVEIVKMLYRGANFLILDEPTAVLTPQETRKLFDVLRNMRADGKSVIIITHKLAEVMEISDRVSVLRRGKYIGSFYTSETNPQQLTEMMVGGAVTLNIDRTEPKNREERLRIQDLTCVNHEGVALLNKVSFAIYSGEILGIAGIAGSGQKELLESIAGLQSARGSILYSDPNTGKQEELIGCSPQKISQMGIAFSFVPEDRLGMGLVGVMDIIDNIMLRKYQQKKGFFADRRPSKQMAENIVEQLSVATPDLFTEIRRLSGGNVQKVLLGREISLEPTVLMSAYAVRGLDIHTSYMIYRLMNEQKEKGTAVIYVGEDLDVLLQLCDRILVMCGGQLSGIVDARTTTKEEVGMLMMQVGGGKTE